MKLFCCYTPAHGVLYEQIFRPSVSADYHLRSFIIGETGPGNYLSPEFLRCVRRKMELVDESLAENPGEVIAWSDVDIRFVDLPARRLLADFDATASDIAFQRESPRLNDVNTGFFVCRATEAVRDFFRRVRQKLEADASMNEQMSANALLSGSGKPVDLPWSYLPCAYYARTHGWPPPRRMALYHANYTKGADAIGQKLAQFAELETILSGGWPAYTASIIRRLPSKLLKRGES